ncbi:hypothetical protein B0H10DRAFT_1952518 [Mycena sp. CBHHK59/15]|nr:hypothetical protein B0H10DRAFT_1962322 [Mycena sp. CBHHK59/15]KAJ6612113.1 hypothetical protein B0H10DRAFT_1952518 [Mycena sp. CBHHK59/15]
MHWQHIPYFPRPYLAGFQRNLAHLHAVMCTTQHSETALRMIRGCIPPRLQNLPETYTPAEMYPGVAAVSVNTLVLRKVRIMIYALQPSTQGLETRQYASAVPRHSTVTTLLVDRLARSGVRSPRATRVGGPHAPAEGARHVRARKTDRARGDPCVEEPVVRQARAGGYVG